MWVNFLRQNLLPFCIFIIALISTAFGDDYQTASLYGVEGYLKPEFAHLISPAIADNYLKLGIIENLYGLRVDAKDLHFEKILSDDPVLKLIQILFYRVPGKDRNLRVPTSGQLVTSCFTESTIGKILNKIIPPLKSVDQSHLVKSLDGMKQELIDIIQDELLRKAARELYQDRHPDQIPDEVKNDPTLLETWPSDEALRSDDMNSLAGLDRRRKELDREAETLSKESHILEKLEGHYKEKKKCEESKSPIPTTLQKDIESLQKSLKSFQEKNSKTTFEQRKKTLDILNQARNNLKRNMQPFSTTETFVSILLDAIKESLKPKSIYSEFIVPHLLLSQQLLKSTDYRDTLLKIWAQIPQALTNEGLELIPGQPTFNSEKSKKFLRGIDQKTKIQALEADSELATYFSLLQTYRDKHRAIAKLSDENPQAFKEELQKLGRPPKNPEMVKRAVKRSFEYIKNPETTLPLLSFTSSMITGFTPPIFNQSLEKIPFKVGGNGPERTSSDCCEASFYNFFLRFIPKKYDKNLLDSGGHLIPKNAQELARDSHKIRFSFEPLINQGVIPRQPIRKFFISSPYETLIDPNNLAKRGEWKALTSNVSEIGQTKGYILQEPSEQDPKWQYDLRPSVDNFIKLVEHFFEIPYSNPGLSRTEKLHEICRVFDCSVEIEPPKEPQPEESWDNVTLRFFESPSADPFKENTHNVGEFEYGEVFQIHIEKPTTTPLNSRRQDPVGHCWTEFYQTKVDGNEWLRAIFYGGTKYLDSVYHGLVPENLSPEEQDGASHVIAKFLEYPQLDKFGYLSSRAIRMRVAGKNLFNKHLLPLFQSYDPRSPESQWLRVLVIIGDQLEEYYPIALKIVDSLTLDKIYLDNPTSKEMNQEHQFSTATTLFYILNAFSLTMPLTIDKKSLDLSKVPTEFRSDFERVVKKLLSNTKTVQVVLDSNRFSGDTREYIRGLQEYFKTH